MEKIVECLLCHCSLQMIVYWRKIALVNVPSMQMFLL
jgi:hypothetical protein